MNDANFKQEVLNSDLPVLVDFWAEWCAPCYMVASTVDAIAKKYKGKLKVCKLNVDQAPRMSSEYGIMSIPTLAIFKDGKVLDKVTGVVPESELASKIKTYI
ncbi:MAG: thioredoxin [Candidatus Omnitrophica bacterium]|nr:thioredoxin [Candidatus Omnitrophota bacterium]